MHFRPLHTLLLLLLLTAALYLPGTGDLPLMDRDEPRFARATAEMMQRGDWVIPWFNGEYRFDKPPLVYWWMRLHHLLLGPGERAARLHSVVAAAAVALMLAAMGRRFFSAKAGWVSGLAWLTCFQVLVHGRLCVADMPMVLAVTAAQWALLELLAADPEKKPWRGWFWVLWGSLGIGFLAKGPVALFIPGLTLILWRGLLWRKPLPWLRLHAGWGWLIALLPVAAWGIPALILTKGQFWNVGIGEHIVHRGTSALNGRLIIPFYYVGSALLSLLPWIAWLPRIVAWTRRGWNARLAFLTAWFLAPQLIFFFYATQLPHYVMPGFPAFFLLFGAALTTSGSPSPGRAGWIYLAFNATLGLGIMAAALGFPFLPAVRTLVLLIGGLLLFAALTGMAVASGRRPAALAAVAGLALSIGLIGPQLRLLHPLTTILPLLQPSLGVEGTKKQEAMAWGYTEPSLVYYGNRSWTFHGKALRLEERLRGQRVETAVTLYQEWTLSAWLKHGLPVEGIPPTRFCGEEHRRFAEAAGEHYEIHWTSGLNPARSSFVQLAIWKRKAAAHPSSPAR